MASLRFIGPESGVLIIGEVLEALEKPLSEPGAIPRREFQGLDFEFVSDDGVVILRSCARLRLSLAPTERGAGFRAGLTRGHRCG